MCLHYNRKIAILKRMSNTLVKESVNIARTLVEPSLGNLVEGPVLALRKSALYVDLAPFGTGIIYGREYISAKDVIKKIALGDLVKAKVVDRENEDGYIELSLKEAKQAQIWHEAEQIIKE